MKKSVLELKSIISAGGSIVINAQDYMPLELKSLASSTRINDGKIYIKNAHKLTTLACKNIVLSGNQGNIIFDFTE